MSVAPYLYGNKSTHRRKRERVELGCALTDAIDMWECDAEFLDDERGPPTVSFPPDDDPFGFPVQPYFTCGCCNDVDQFALAHKDTRPRTTERYRTALRLRLRRRLMPANRMRWFWEMLGALP